MAWFNLMFAGLAVAVASVLLAFALGGDAMLDEGGWFPVLWAVLAIGTIGGLVSAVLGFCAALRDDLGR